MIDGGAIEEVETLLARDLDPALPAMKAVGVRELAVWITGEMTRATAVEALTLADPAVRRALNGAVPRKVIVVADRIVNLVV